MDFKRIDKLIEKIKKLDGEKRIFLERIEKLKEKKGSISDIVYQKVKGDYDKKVDTLDAEIYPLVEQLAVQKSEVESMLKEIEQELSEVNIKKEEIQVRCDLGEFSQKKADEMIKAIEDENKERFDLFEKLKNYSKKMEEVLRENVLMQETTTPDFEEDEEDKTEAGAINDVNQEDLEDAFETKTGIDTSFMQDSEEDKTVFAPSAPVGAEGKTMLIRQPVLEIISGENAGTQFRLKLGTTNIGSDESNDIVLNDFSVEFKHAQVVFEPDGFKIYDFNSEKGVFVNGKRVSECILNEGDEIVLGAVRLKFKN